MLHPLHAHIRSIALMHAAWVCGLLMFLYTVRYHATASREPAAACYADDVCRCCGCLSHL
jgi:hypothetical protein